MFRSIADMREIRDAATTARTAVVVGGGLLGLEAARGLRELGVDVTVVHLADRLMELQLDPLAARLLERRIRALGITVLCSRRTEAVLEDGVALADGAVLPADLVVFATGIRPEVALARDAGLELGRGVLVDDNLRASAPGVFAVGECAEHRGTVYGLWAPVLEQARAAGAAIAGRPAAFLGAVPATTLKVAGIDLFCAGHAAETDELADEVIALDSRRERYRKLVVKDGRLSGATLLGELGDARTLRELIANGGPVPEALLELGGAEQRPDRPPRLLLPGRLRRRDPRGDRRARPHDRRGRVRAHRRRDRLRRLPPGRGGAARGVVFRALPGLPKGGRMKGRNLVAGAAAAALAVGAYARGRQPERGAGDGADAGRPVGDVHTGPQEGPLHRSHAHDHAQPARLEGLRAGEVQPDRRSGDGRAVHVRQERLRGHALRAGHRPVRHPARPARALGAGVPGDRRAAGDLRRPAARGDLDRRPGQEEGRLPPAGRRHQGLGEEARPDPRGLGGDGPLGLVEEVDDGRRGGQEAGAGPGLPGRRPEGDQVPAPAAQDPLPRP